VFRIEFTGGALGDLDYFRKAETPDGREYILSEVDDLSHEIGQIRNNPELLAFLARSVLVRKRPSVWMRSSESSGCRVQYR
jgi:hypothetical protein